VTFALEDVSRRYGAPFWDFHRAELHRVLHHEAVRMGTHVHLNARVETIDFEAGRATLTTGEVFEADLIVGCDGLNSRTRECFLGRRDPPTPTGDVAFRIMLNVDKMQQDPELRQFLADQPMVNYWAGPHCHVVNYLLRGEKYFNMVCTLDIFLLLIPLGEAFRVWTSDEQNRAIYRSSAVPTISPTVHQHRLLRRWPRREVG
jgi:salicylate hydroxylase